MTTVLEGDADEARVAAHVDTLLRRRFGLRLDMTRISVVEESGPEPGWDRETLEEPSGRPRVAIVALRVTADVTEISSEVTLARGRSIFSGTGTARSDDESHLSTARAVVAALRSRYPSVRSRSPIVEHVARVDLRGEEVAVVIVSTGSPSELRSEVRKASAAKGKLTGISIVRDNIGQAVVRATLDSLNRTVEEAPR